MPLISGTERLRGRGFERKDACVHIITFRATTRLRSKSNRCIWRTILAIWLLRTPEEYWCTDGNWGIFLLNFHTPPVTTVLDKFRPWRYLAVTGSCICYRMVNTWVRCRRIYEIGMRPSTSTWVSSCFPTFEREVCVCTHVRVYTFSMCVHILNLVHVLRTKLRSIVHTVTVSL